MATKGFKPGHPYRWPKGVSGNPGGRPKVVSKAYNAWLAAIDPKTGMTNAEIVAEKIGAKASKGGIEAAREIRMATEGTKINVTDESLTDTERLDRIVALLERARARRDGQAAKGSKQLPSEGGGEILTDE